jgi:hypothetical protein
MMAEGFGVAGIFWGLWLFPFGILVFKSGFLPRILGVLLIAACFGYLADSLTSLLLPSYEDGVGRIANIPLTLGEPAIKCCRTPGVGLHVRRLPSDVGKPEVMAKITEMSCCFPGPSSPRSECDGRVR